MSISLEIVRILLDKAIEEDRHGLVLRDLPHVLTEMVNLWDAIEQVNALGNKYCMANTMVSIIVI